MDKDGAKNLKEIRKRNSRISPGNIAESLCKDCKCDEYAGTTCKNTCCSLFWGGKIGFFFHSMANKSL
jgi:hypothetical protein